jgi:hypothetical protein
MKINSTYAMSLDFSQRPTLSSHPARLKNKEKMSVNSSRLQSMSIFSETLDCKLLSASFLSCPNFAAF